MYDVQSVPFSTLEDIDQEKFKSHYLPEIHLSNDIEQSHRTLQQLAAKRFMIELAPSILSAERAKRSNQNPKRDRWPCRGCNKNVR